MNDERLNEAAWKAFATKHKIKDTALQRLLTSLAAADPVNFEERLDLLAKITKEAETLKKAYKFEKLATEYLKDIQSGVESDKAVIAKEAEKQKAGQKGGEAKTVTNDKASPPAPVINSQNDKPKEGNAPPAVDLSKVKSSVLGALGMVKQKKPEDKQLGFMVGVCTGRSRVLLAPQVGSAHKSLLTQMLAGMSGAKFFQGECRWEEGAYTFVLDTVPSGLSKNLQSALLDETGGTHRVRVRSFDGKTVADSDTEKEGETAGVTKPPVTKAPVKTTGPETSAPLESQWKKIKAELAPGIKAIMGGTSPARAEVGRLLAAGLAAEKSGAFAKAMEAFEQIRPLLAPVARTGGDAEKDSAAEFKRRVDLLKPDLKRILDGNLGEAAKVRAGVALAQGHAKAGKYALAIEALDALKILVEASLSSAPPRTETTSGTSAPPETESPEGEDEDPEVANELREVAWESESARLEPKLLYVLGEQAGDPDKMRATFAFAQGKAETHDYAAALQSLRTLEKLLDDAIKESSGIDLDEEKPRPAELMFKSAQADLSDLVQAGLALTGGSSKLTSLVSQATTLDTKVKKLASEGSFVEALAALKQLQSLSSEALELKSEEDRQREEQHAAYNLALFDLNVDFRAALTLDKANEAVAKLTGEMQTLFKDAHKLAGEGKYVEAREKILAAQEKAREAITAAAKAPRPVEPTDREKYEAAVLAMQSLIDSALSIEKGDPNLLSMKGGLVKLIARRDKLVESESFADALKELQLAHGTAQRLMELKKEAELEALDHSKYNSLRWNFSASLQFSENTLCPTPETLELQGRVTRDYQAAMVAALNGRFTTAIKLFEAAQQALKERDQLLKELKGTQVKDSESFKKAYNSLKTRIDAVREATPTDPGLVEKRKAVSALYSKVRPLVKDKYFTLAKEALAEVEKALVIYEEAEKERAALLKKQKEDYEAGYKKYRNRVVKAEKIEKVPSIAKAQEALKEARLEMEKAATAKDYAKALELLPTTITKLRRVENGHKAFLAKKEEEYDALMLLLQPLESRLAAFSDEDIEGDALTKLANTLWSALETLNETTDVKEDYVAAAGLVPGLIKALEALEKAHADHLKEKTAYFNVLDGAKGRFAEAAKFGDVEPKIDALKLAYEKARVESETSAGLHTYGDAKTKIEDAIQKVDVLLDAKQKHAKAKSEEFKNYRDEAVRGREAELSAIERTPTGIEDALKKVSAAQEESKKLGKSKGLEALLAEAEKVQKAYKAVLKEFRDLDGSGIDPLIRKIDTARDNVAAFQREHPATKGKDDKAKFDEAETIREAYVEMRAGLVPCRAGINFVNGKLSGADDQSCAEAAAYLVKIIKSKAPPELRMGAQIKLRELSQRLLAAATTPDRKREIGDLIGGPLGASIQRQVVKPSMKDTLATSGDGKRFHSTKVVDPRRAELTNHARLLADRMFDDAGVFEPATLLLHNPEELAETLGKGPHAEQMVRALKALRDRPELQEILQSIPAPAPENPMTDMIRATLGLGPDEPVTDAHARKAVLSSYLAELRQGEVGSCFGTSVAIHLHDNKPERMFADMKELCATGKMVRQVKGETVEIPMQRDLSDGALKEPLTFQKSDGMVAESSRSIFSKARKVEELPPLDTIVTNLGLANPSVDVAATIPQARLYKSLDTALKKLPKEKQAAIRRAAIRKMEADNITTDDKIPDLIRDIVDADGDIDPADRDEAATAASNFLTQDRYDVPVDEIIQGLALKASGLTAADLTLFEERAELGARIQALQGQAKTPEDEKLLTEYSKLDTKLKPKFAAYTKYVGKVSAGKNSLCGAPENRLLRAWEYSVSSMAERGIAGEHTNKMNDATVEALTETTDDVFNKLKLDKKAKTPPGPEASKFEKDAAKALGKISTSDLDKISKKLQLKYQELLKKTLKAGYDAGVQNTDVSADGSSTEGAFFLYDTQGISDPTKWIKIDNQKKYGTVVGGLVMLAWREIYGSEKDETTLNVSRMAAERLSDAVRAESFASKAKGKRATASGSDKNSPWQQISGSDERLVMDTYFGTEFGKDNAESPNFYPKNSEELLGTIVERMQGSWDKISADVLADPEGASVMMGNSVHAFALKPGLFKGAMTDGKSPADWTAEVVATEKSKNTEMKATQLTDALRDELIKSALGSKYSDLAIRNDLIGRLPPNAKVSDFDAALQAHAANCPEYTDRADAVERYKDKGAAAIVNSVIPPLEGDALEKAIDEILIDLKIPQEDRADVKSEALKNCGAKADMAKIEKAMIDAFATTGYDADPNDAPGVQQSLKKQLKPKGVVFADSNWGGGDHKTVLSMVVNPVSGELETWAMNEDGTAARKMNQEKWAEGRWNIDSAPETHGGV